MALNIPLPEAPPGGFYGGMKAANEVARQNLENQYKQLLNKYYGPVTESQIVNRNALTTGYNIANQYSPEKLRLGNEKLAQDVYFSPLEIAIKASNARVHANRFNDIGNYLRFVGSMTADQKTSYLADPNNKAFHDQMVEQFKEGMNNPQTNIDLLPQEFLQKYFPLNQQQNKVSNLPYEQQNNLNKQNVQPLSSGNEINRPGSNFLQQNIPVNDNQKQKAPTQASSPDQQLYQNQMNANDNLISPQTKQRVDGAIQFEKFLMNNRDKISRALNNANKYSGWIGQGKKGMDQILNTDPDAYSDLLWLESSFVPTISNSIRFMEGLSTSDTQREELTKMSNAIGNWKYNPSLAIKLMNKQIGTLQDVSDSVIETAEPAYKGVTRKLHNLKKLKEGENYIKTTEQLNEVIAISPKGRRVVGTKKQIDNLIKDHPEWKVE